MQYWGEYFEIASVDIYVDGPRLVEYLYIRISMLEWPKTNIFKRKFTEL